MLRVRQSVHFSALKHDIMMHDVDRADAVAVVVAVDIYVVQHDRLLWCQCSWSAPDAIPFTDALLGSAGLIHVDE